MRIRTYLLIFALVILVPMIAFAAIAVVAFDRQQRAAVERGGVETARALMNAVDRELTGSIATLQALATARSLERGDLRTFHEDARRVLASQRDWRTIILIAPSGQPVLNAGVPFGAPPSGVQEPESLEVVLPPSPSPRRVRRRSMPWPAPSGRGSPSASTRSRSGARC